MITSDLMYSEYVVEMVVLSNDDLNCCVSNKLSLKSARERLQFNKLSLKSDEMSVAFHVCCVPVYHILNISYTLCYYISDDSR